MTDDEINALKSELATAQENIRLGEVEREKYQEQIEQLSAQIIEAEAARDAALAEKQALLTLATSAQSTEKALREQIEVWKRKAASQERLHLQAVERVKHIKEGREPIVAR